MMLPRYFTYSTFEIYFKDIVHSLYINPVSLECIGSSVLGNDVYCLKLGNGKHRVLAWSNMHGNESTTTRAILEFLQRDDLALLLMDITLWIIPVLNPDGLNAGTRENANGIDLNRDAITLSQPESVLLRAVFECLQPHYCFNMHDQRSIYGDKNGRDAVQLSFLAPAANQERTITPARITAMRIINAIHDKLVGETTGIIGRFSDAFNPNCVGDYMQRCGVPTILFEAGHAGHDYYREQAVALIAASFVEALQEVTNDQSLSECDITERYAMIPDIYPSYVDLLIKNIPCETGSKKDIAIQYYEIVVDGILYFVPILVGVDVQDIKNAHQVIDCNDATHYAADLFIDAQLKVTCKSLNVLTFH